MEVRFDQLFDEEHAPVANFNNPAKNLWNLDSREKVYASLWVVEANGEREAEATDVGEGVPGVNGEWCEDGEDLLCKSGGEALSHHLFQVGPLHERHPCSRELTHEVSPGLLLRYCKEGGRLTDRVHLFKWCAAVCTRYAQPCINLFANARDAHAEEFVHVRRDDAEEPEAVKQQRALILRLVQDACVEGEHGELATDDRVSALAVVPVAHQLLWFCSPRQSAQEQFFRRSVQV